MAINYTTLLGLAQPVTGTESGVWGDVVNNQITSLLEDAIANAATINVTSANVTLTDNNGAADQSRMAILLVTGTPGTTRNIVAPSTSKWYIVRNGSNAAVVIKGSATTGVTIPTGSDALVFWNGSDFEVGAVAGPASSTDNAVVRYDGTTGKVVQNSGVTIDDSNNVGGLANLNFSGTGNRITGDFSNATAANRVMFQTSTSNSNTILSAIPTGTGNTSALRLFNAADSANSASALISVSSTAATLESQISGTGTYVPLIFSTGGSERVRVSTSGNVGIGTSTSTSPLSVKTDSDFVISMRTTAASTGARVVALNLAENAYKDLVVDGTTVQIATGGTERMRITSGGDVGIGVTSTAAKLDVLGAATAPGLRILGGGNSGINIATFADAGGAGQVTINPSGNLLVGTTTSAGKLTVTTSSGQGGHFSVSGGTGFPVVASVNFVSSTATAGVRVLKYDNNTTTSQVFVQFAVNQDGANCGQINANGTNTAAFGTYSDARLKENITDLPSQLASILALRPVEFDYIQSEGGGHQIGFIAQEMEQVYPDVVGERADGMKTITAWSKTEARLVKAIQEQQAIIEQLTQRIAALENKGA